MTISTETSKLVYTCDASTVIFPYTFYIIEDSDLKVTLYTIADGTETELTLTTHYTVSGAGNASGGNVTTVATYSALYKLIIERDMPYTQTVDYTTAGDFSASNHETALDKIVMQIQQIRNDLNRALIRDATQTAQLQLPDFEAGKFLYTDGSTLSWADDTDLSGITTWTGTIGNGLDANKTATPTKNDLYYATDTRKWYFCYADNNWQDMAHIAIASSDTFKVMDSSLNTVMDIDESGNIRCAGHVTANHTF